MITDYFTALKTSVDGVDPRNILNYDETCFQDDSGKKKVRHFKYF